MVGCGRFRLGNPGELERNPGAGNGRHRPLRGRKRRAHTGIALGTGVTVANIALAVTLRGGSTLDYTGATATSTKKFMVNGTDNRFYIGNAAAELTLAGVIGNVSSSFMGESKRRDRAPWSSARPTRTGAA